MAGKRKRRGPRRSSPIAAVIFDAFDAEHYARQLANLGIAVSGADFVDHYIDAGAKLGLDPNTRFSSRFYLKTYPDVAEGDINPFWHYLVHGQYEGRRPTEPDITEPLSTIRDEFDESHYRQQLSERGMDPPLIDCAAHYIVIGAALGLDPSPKFSTAYYLSSYPDVASTEVNPFFHYLLYGRLEGRSCSPIPTYNPAHMEMADAIRTEFDAEHYLQMLRALGFDAPKDSDLALHYIEVGAGLGVDPRESFSTENYLRANPDVGAASVNAFWHYVVAGRTEGRALTPDSERATYESEADVVAAEFDQEFYLAKYQDVALANVDSLKHFLETGWREGRDPNHHFSCADYLESYPDIRDARINPFVHYLKTGRLEGRSPKQDLGFRYEVLKKLETVEDMIVQAKCHFPRRPVTDGGLLAQKIKTELRGSNGLIVSVSHDDFHSNVGGIQLCLMRESTGLISRGFTYLHLSPSVPLPIVNANYRHSQLIVNVNGDNLGVLDPSTIAEILGRQSRTRKINGVAIHSLLGHHERAIISIAKSASALKGWFWIHDFASLCAGFNLMRNDVQYCDAPDEQSGGCLICKYSFHRKGNSVAYSKVLSTLDLTPVAPSKSALEIWSKKFPNLKSVSRVHPHCQLKNKTRKARRRKGAALRIAYIGYPVLHKGWHVFRDLAQKFRGTAGLEFIHIGKLRDPSVSIQFHEVAISPTDMNAMTRAVKKLGIDVAIIWSLWPETFCFAAYEAVAGGAIIFTCQDSGNVAQFVRSTGLGRVFADEFELATFLTDPKGEGPEQLLSKSFFELEYSGMSADLLESLTS
jgi:hypothetical protein